MSHNDTKEILKRSTLFPHAKNMSHNDTKEILQYRAAHYYNNLPQNGTLKIQSCSILYMIKRSHSV
jgi:hypothetical protein